MPIYILLFLSCSACQAQNTEPARQLDIRHQQNEKMIDDSLQKVLATHMHLLASEHGDRQVGVRWLVENDTIARPALLNLLREEGRKWEKAAAIEALGKIGHPDDVPVLADMIPTASGLSWEACQALAVHPDRLAGEMLRTSLRSLDNAQIAHALVALGMRKDPEMRAEIEAYLTHASATLRWKAAHALELLGTQESKELLQQRLAVEPEAEVRDKLQAVLKALESVD